MNSRMLKWKIRQNDLKSATMMLEYHHGDGSMGDIIAVPIGSLQPATLVQLSSCAKDDRYRVLFQSGAIIYSPVSMSTLMTSNYDDVRWDTEDGKVKDTVLGHLHRVSMSIMRGDSNVYTIEFPEPDEKTLKKLLPAASV